MNEPIHYYVCPICDSPDISFVFKAEDKTVSRQTFQIWQCNSCTARFTQDVPEERHIGAYYRSSNYISHSNTSKGLVNKLYHSVRSVTLRSKRKLVEAYATKGNLIDMGAGTGAFASAMQKSGWNVTGLEPDASARSNAKKDFNIELLTGQEIFGLEHDHYDVITLWHVLEHVHQLHIYLGLFFTLLKKNGILVVAVPNYTSYDAQVYKQNWAAYDVPRHLYHFSPASMEYLLTLHQFTPVAQKPMWFDSFYVSLLSEKIASGESNLLSAFANGAVSNFKAVNKTERCSSVIYIAKK